MQIATRKDSASSGKVAPRTPILIVDDDIVLGRTLAQTLKRFGGAATVVGTVREALGELDDPADWAGVILDLCLPDGPGMRVLDSLRERAESDVILPVLVHTGYPDHPSISAAYNLRAQFLEKPSSTAQIEQFFRFAQQHARNRGGRAEPAATLDTPDDADPSSRFVAAVLRERRTAAAGALRSFWRIGALVNGLRNDAKPHCFRATLAQCAARLGVHAAWLDDAARAAFAMPEAERLLLIEACKDGRAHLTPSHISELARAHPRSRREGIAALLSADISVRRLRERLRG